MATSDKDIDMAREALDLAGSWGSVDLDAGQIQELARTLRDAWRAGRKSADDPLGVLEAARKLRERGCSGDNTVDVMAHAALLLGDMLGLRAALDAHAECAEELRAVGCQGATTTAVMTHAVERLKRAAEAEAEQNRVIEALAKRVDGEGKEAEESKRMIRGDLGVARSTIKSLKAELVDSENRCLRLRACQRNGEERLKDVLQDQLDQTGMELVAARVSATNGHNRIAHLETTRDRLGAALGEAD